MRFLFLFVSIFTSSSYAALPPPQGKSVSAENQYNFEAQNLPWYDVPGRIEQRNRLKSEEIVGEKPKVAANTKQGKVARGKKTESLMIVRSSAERAENTNLPSYYAGIDRGNMKASDRVVYVPQNSVVKLASVKSGDIFKAVIEQEIKASPSVPTPVRAVVLSGGLKGGYFVGEATLDRELKRILFNFNKVRSSDGKTYAIRAAALAPGGSVGLEGEYHSQSGTFFLAELGAATAAGILDSTVNRNQTAFGTYVQEPSIQNSAKTGAVTALSRTADRMAEGARQAPEFTAIQGYQPIQIIVQDDPTETN